MSKTIREISEIAANWWGNVVVKPKFDNGDNSKAGAIGMMMCNMLVKPVEDTSKEQFIQELSKSIEEALNKGRDPYLDVDYHPSKILDDAATKSNIPGTNFPIKTCMRVDENHISVWYGYRASEEILYTNEKFLKKRIESTEETLVGYENNEYLHYITDLKEREEAKQDRIRELKTTLSDYKTRLESLKE